MVARAALANARSCKGGRQRPEICFTNRTKVISTYPCGPSSLDENSARFAISSLNRLMRRSALSRDGKFRDPRSAIPTRWVGIREDSYPCPPKPTLSDLSKIPARHCTVGGSEQHGHRLSPFGKLGLSRLRSPKPSRDRFSLRKPQ